MSGESLYGLEGGERLFHWNENSLPERVESRLDERIEAAKDILESGSGRRGGSFPADWFIEVSEELKENWGRYGNDFYHGTSSLALDDIIERGGLMPGDRIETEVGERGYTPQVSLTSLVSGGLHYGNEAFPTRFRDVYDFVRSNLDPDNLLEHVDPESPVSRTVLNEHVTQVIESYKDNPIPPATTKDDVKIWIPPEERDEEEIHQNEDTTVDVDERHATAATIRQLGQYQEETNGFQDLPEDETYPVDPIMIGLNEDRIVGLPEDAITLRDELAALEKEENLDRLGETQVEEAYIEGANIYVQHEFRDHYEEKYADEDVEILDLDALLLKHELYMAPQYEEHGTIDYGSYWSGGELGLFPSYPDWDDRPTSIDVSG